MQIAFRRDGEIALRLDPMPITTRWQLATVPLDGEANEGDWSIELEAPEGLVLELVLPGAPGTAWSAEQALRHVAAHFAARQARDEERIAWDSLAALLPRTGRAAVALRTSADLLAAAGEADTAANTYLQALDELGPDVDSWRTFPGGEGYGQNRMVVDFGSQVRARLADIAQKASPDVAAEARRAAALDYPLTPTAKAAALGYAQVLAQVGAVAETPAWLVLVLDQGGDHDPVQARLRLSENQRHLDAISKPTDGALLGATFTLLLAAGGDVLTDEDLALAVDAWVAGEQAGLHRDHETCAAQFTRAAEACAQTVLEPCARIALSQWLRYLGYFAEAVEALPDREAIADEAVRQWRDFVLGALLVSQGIYDEAAEAYRRVVAGPSVVLADHGQLYLGECLEFQGLWEQAARTYAELASGGASADIRRKGRFWEHRVANLAADYKPAMGGDAVYWGEDRQTQGRWEEYGRELFLICARLAPGDLMGGFAAPAYYRVYVADPKKHYWWWNWHAVTEHPSLLVDPPSATPTACNWDDGGEKQAVGTGPDLMVDLPVPEGLHRLSLYVVNDFNYYEPNREYTIYLLDEHGQVIAACPVRHHEGGVYHHFRVTGPRTLTIRIFRNLSMNTLLQGIFLDHIDTRAELPDPPGDFGPFGEVLHAERSHIDRPTPVMLLGAQERREAIRALLAGGRESPLACWQDARLLNAYGAGLGYEERFLDRIYAMMLAELGAGGSIDFWSRTADAQLQAGHRTGAVRFTRWAHRAAHEAEMADGELLSFLDRALERMHTRYPYYMSGSRQVPTSPLEKAVSEPYARQLADEYIAVAFEGRTLMHAAAHVLPMARKYLELEGRSIPKRFFEAVGMENLAAPDLYKYARCCDDDQVRAEALERAVAAGVAQGDASDAWGRIQLISALALAARFDDAEAELESFLARDDVPASLKANAAWNVAYRFMLQGHKDRARKWCEYTVEHYPDTHFAKNARTALNQGLKLPWEE